ncbi:3-hydroxyacyl-ACP dehydratase [Bacillus aquiflavi]|uniref:3-hydroxyacyl-ACP dehydratase n=1 Tax=Bacillus aquiflavi TaxID=2672567 RepID=A0A6B3VUJ3_9BACI|nr:MaoC/PaaZ C-terminal domain-containing protein [Bacillus aquiflavi]MBA4536541.1 3-hydroxyacyl-ACP dehydratase [Bacillus aquiflavi]NEY80908.1 3-hydroxyacyl-ACP dehydratase [Bacillus aquiflavi]UAC49628.1 MaoC family dehydratase N-terminal domain-containing protein [Bacillus aquiflavi]
MTELTPIVKEKITHTQLVKYAGASGDFNPIHTVVPVANKAGLNDVIAHGMLVMGMAGEALTRWFKREQIKKFQVRFAKMTFPGEILTISGKLEDQYEENNEIFQKGKLQVVNQEGEVKLKGKFTIIH